MVHGIHTYLGGPMTSGARGGRPPCPPRADLHATNGWFPIFSSSLDGVCSAPLREAAAATLCETIVIAPLREADLWRSHGLGNPNRRRVAAHQILQREPCHRPLHRALWSYHPSWSKRSTPQVRDNTDAA